MFVWQTLSMTPKELIAQIGGSAVLAAPLGISRVTPLNWRQIPPHHCPVIEREFGIPREELRPDLFARPTPEAANV